MYRCPEVAVTQTKGSGVEHDESIGDARRFTLNMGVIFLKSILSDSESSSNQREFHSTSAWTPLFFVNSCAYLLVLTNDLRSILPPHHLF
jgi:hypothetical protein